MSHARRSASVRVEALEPAFAQAAAAWAERLNLHSEGEAEFALQVGRAGLQFVDLSPHAAGPVRADFLAGPGGAPPAIRWRERADDRQGRSGIQPGIRPRVLDATAGLGRDAFVLARLGCTLTLIERQPLIAALLEDALQRALADQEVATIVAQMHLLCGNAIDLMRAWEGESATGDLP